MPTPSIQTLVTDAQQVLNLDSISAVRSVVAVALANANTGTPLNPNLTTQQLWNEFYQVVTKPKSDIESIIANQLMKFLYSPPAPGGVGADKQVIFNDGGVLAGDAGMTYDKATDRLIVLGGIGVGTSPSAWGSMLPVQVRGAAFVCDDVVNRGRLITNAFFDGAGYKYIQNNFAQMYVQNSLDGTHGWLTAPSGTAGSAVTFTQVMWLDRPGNLGIGVLPSNWGGSRKALQISSPANIVSANLTLEIGSNWYNDGTNYRYTASNPASLYSPSNGAHAWFNAPAGTIGNTISFVQAMSLDASGNLAPIGNFVAANGKGIDFSATPQPAGATSELLSDYEEGTWTGTLNGGTTNPTTPVTATGRYTKIGRQVFVQIDFNNFSNAGASGHITVTGLPFSATGGPCIGIPFMNKVGTYTGTPFMYLSGTVIELYAMTSGAQETLITHNAGTGRYMILTITYTV